ncbi:MAG: hypothetical protein ABR527_00390 [Gemmatimonadota bacterium]
MTDEESFELKPIRREAVPAALEKAEHYRLLNQPGAAESICRDVLRVDPDNQRAIITLMLSLTDQFGRPGRWRVGDARVIAEQIASEYEKSYYHGLISERAGKAELQRGGPSAEPAAHNWLREAMGWYEKAEDLRPPGNDDAILRWNACARILRDRRMSPRVEDRLEHPIE